MGRLTGNNSGNFRIREVEPGWYRISWTVDRFYAGSRLRHPVSYSRETDKAGAERFCKKHKIKMPDVAT